MYNKQRDNHNRRQIAGKKPRIYAVFKIFCIVASQANHRQMTSKHQSTMHFHFFKSPRNHGLCGFQHRAKSFLNLY